MGKVSNPWSGNRSFSKGYSSALTKKTAALDKDYQKYLKRKLKMKNQKRDPLSYSDWCKRERLKRGMF
jgi:hypothetical protein